MAKKEKKIESDKNTIPDWKSALSGALNDTQLTFAIIILFGFFGVYILFDGIYDNNRKDVAAVKDIQNAGCNCEPAHRNFYIAWFTICSTVWVVGPFVLWIFQCSNCCRTKLNCTNALILFQNIFTGIAERIKACNSEQLKEMANTILGVVKLFKIDKIAAGPLKKIEHLKWLEYYNMHITGTDVKRIKFKKIRKRILKVIGPVEKQNDNSDQVAKQNQEEKREMIDEEVDLEEIESNYCCGCCFLFYAVCFVLECGRIIAQRATVPLLMIQAFDTYAFLCFTGNQFCTATAQYDIPLGQAAFTFAFSVSIMASTLTVAMLKWFKYQRKKFLCCCINEVKCNQYKWIQSCI